jgi:hypothetical protein
LRRNHGFNAVGLGACLVKTAGEDAGRYRVMTTAGGDAGRYRVMTTAGGDAGRYG